MEKLYLGVEIGATKQQLAIGTREGDLLEVFQDKFPLPNGAEDVLDWLKKHIPRLLTSKQEYKSVCSVAVGFGGPLESKTGRILSSIQVKGWEGFKLREWMEKQFSLPALVINDTVAGGFSELYKGHGASSNNVYYTNLGSGIGGVLFIDRKYYDGIGFGASYLGNSYIPDWHENKPGAVTRVETICSGYGIEKRLRERGYVPKTSIMHTLCGNRPEEMTCRILDEAARAGDTFALAEIDRVAESLGIGLSNVLALLSPELIIIGGGVAKMGELLFEPIRKYTDKYAFIANKNRYKILQSQLLDDAVIVGAIICAANSEEQ